MAFELHRSKFSQVPGEEELPAADSTTFTIGAAVYRASGVLNVCDGSTETVKSIYGVVNETKTTTTSEKIKVIPIVDGLLWKINCDNNTASTQILKTHNLGSAGLTIDNNATEDETTAGVFMITHITGTASDKKAIGEFVKLPQVTA